MQVDDALVEKLARLSMLEFAAEERDAIKADLEKMIGFVDKLKELDTAGVEPLLHITEAVNVLRNDVPEPMLSQEEALRNAPQHNGSAFLVPKVIKKGEG